MPLTTKQAHYLAGFAAASHDGWDAVGCRSFIDKMLTDPRPAKVLAVQIISRSLEAKWDTPRGLLEPLTDEPATVQSGFVSRAPEDRPVCEIHGSDLYANDGQFLCCWQEKRGLNGSSERVVVERTAEDGGYVPAEARELIEASIGPRAEAKRQAGSVVSGQEGGE